MIVTLFFFACNTAFGGVMLSTSIQNGSFESGLTNFSVVGNATIETAAFGSGPTDGTSQALLSTGDGDLLFPGDPLFPGDLTVTDGEIETFLGLSSGALDALLEQSPDALANDPFFPFPPLFPLVDSGSAISQSITGQAGDVLSFDSNFLTDEIDEFVSETPFNDFAFFSLANAQGATVIADTFSGFSSSSTIFESETGFSTTTFVLPSSGTFTLGFGVVDVGDNVVDSGLLIDNVQLNSNSGVVPEPTSLSIFGAMGLAAVIRRRKSCRTTLAN